ncbi:hypothetical protein RF11_11101 [Thelohanellus kitauei]|uniref:Uncharacterized protein n=1 Tax=Thelohanellus kitauei TaxID=669202 RepID=A0A0C2MZ83_THEKT|nr:hypothetical protein RF11_11101 [Thelohanellus kitauei]
MDFEQFSQIASDPVSAIGFLRHYGILPEEKFCEGCSSKMAEHQRPDISDKVFMGGSYVGIPSNRYRAVSVTFENDIGKKTQICSWKLSTQNLILGGPGHIVQIDESVISRAMHNRGHDLLRPQRWVLGMYDAASKVILEPET